MISFVPTAQSARTEAGSFELGSTVYVHDQQGTIVWDGRPEHEFVKLKWLSGKEKGKPSEVIPVSQVKVSGPNVTVAVRRRGRKRRGPKGAEPGHQEPTPPVADAQVLRVVKAWEPLDDLPLDDVQLLVVPDDHLFLEWRQPKQEGGYWGYGRLLCAPERPGYVPLHCLGGPADLGTRPPR